ncbi:MAG: hypothetical protein IKB02_01860 [Clostridia bacterium]|nr:hypothetical protein [Clostridia bacterium]
MKIKLLSLVSVILLVVVVLPLSSCQKGETENFDDLYEAISIYEEMVSKQEELEALDSKKTYVIIIPVNCGADIFNSAVLLSGVMSKNVGYDVKVYYDSELKTKSSNFEILIGATDREKSQRYMKGLRTCDYGYEYYDGAVTVGGHSDELLSRAVAELADGIDSEKVSTVYINTTKPFSVSSDYEINSATLCGFPLSEYVIVYPKNNKLFEKSIAEYLRKSLEEYAGYSLPVVSDSEVSEAAKFICVGKSSLTKISPVSSTATVAAGENGVIELLAEDNYGLKLCTDELLRQFKESESEGVCNLWLQGTTRIPYQNELISFYLVRDDYLSSDVDAYRNSVNGVLDSTISVFDRLSSSVLTNLRRNLLQLINLSNNSFYYYDTLNFRCVESRSVLVGEGEIITLVMENLRGEKIAFVGGFNNNTQKLITSTEFCDALSAECQKYRDIPLLVAHELSAEVDSEFAKENPYIESVGVEKGIYVTCDRLEVVSNTENEISYPLFANTVKLRFCFK